jgi:hypothetical protein
MYLPMPIMFNRYLIVLINMTSSFFAGGATRTAAAARVSRGRRVECVGARTDAVDSRAQCGLMKTRAPPLAGDPPVAQLALSAEMSIRRNVECLDIEDRLRFF